MANPEITNRVDDGKGREKPVPTRPDVLPLRHRLGLLKENLLPGEYLWIKTIEISFLILACPFCGTESPLPHTFKVLTKDPLTLEKEIFCGHCGETFHVLNNQAIRSWGSIDPPEATSP